MFLYSVNDIVKARNLYLALDLMTIITNHCSKAYEISYEERPDTGIYLKLLMKLSSHKQADGAKL
jgi:hypothetical protein